MNTESKTFVPRQLAHIQQNVGVFHIRYAGFQDVK